MPLRTRQRNTPLIQRRSGDCHSGVTRPGILTRHVVAGLRRIHYRGVSRGINLEQEVARFNVIVLTHMNGDDGARDTRCHVHQVRLHVGILRGRMLLSIEPVVPHAETDPKTEQQ